MGPVVSAVSQWVPGLRKGSGENWLGFCPIHGETPGRSKPSFSLHSGTGQWHCFAGCGGGGLPQLLKALGKSRKFTDRTMERLGGHIRPAKRKAETATQERLFHTNYPLPERILGLWQYLPEDLVHPRVGLEEYVLEDHDIGFDPERSRIVFPVRDVAGTLAGVIGKPTGPDARGKYLVYEHELRDMGFKNYHMDKSRYLWRWERVYPAVYHRDGPATVHIVEGFKACMWMVQYGFENTMALMTSSISELQIMFLQRLGARVVLCLDDDNAGRRGTSKVGGRLKGLRVDVIRYPYRYFNLQPDDLEESELQEAVHNPYSLAQWRRVYGISPKTCHQRRG